MKLSTSLLLLASPVLAFAQAIDNAPFADSLTTALYDDPDDNECTSSLGVSMAMSLIYPSAISDTELQMRTVLGYPEESQSMLLWQNTSTSLTSRYQGRCYNEFDGECGGTEPSIEIANRVFVHDNITLNATYVAVVGEYVEQLDFLSDQAGGMVNAWVNESTNGLIDSIVEEGSMEDWIVLAINSIYLKASWINQFDEASTNSDVFVTSLTDDSETTEAHFMHNVDDFPYSHVALPGYQVLQHSFAGGADSNGLSMIFVLPMPGVSAMVSSVDVLGALDSLERTRIALALPKFKFESEYEDDLKEALQATGITAAFEGRPDNMCIADGRCDAFIDMIIQKTIIDVNEKGVEAAAVTAIGVSLTSMPPPQATLFSADRPFQFFIHDQVENVVLFEGQVGEPEISEGSAAPLQAKHADADFWQTNFNVMAEMPVAPNTSAPETTLPPSTSTSDDPGSSASSFFRPTFTTLITFLVGLFLLLTSL